MKERAKKYQSKDNEKWINYMRKRDKFDNMTEERKQYIRDFQKEWRKEGKHKEWYNENQDKLREYNRKRRGKNHTITKDQWTNCKAYFDDCCAYCGMPFAEHKIKYKQDLHKEHVDCNGLGDLSNCVPSCKKCNGDKWEYDFSDWYTESNHRYTIERYHKIMKWLNEDYKGCI